MASVLVANRGEIARRVFRSARAMGLRCIAVYAAADADAPFVAEADEAVRLPHGYLDAEAILAAAHAAGTDAIHPGYGFLSENADFAQAVIDTGLIWVGPQPEVIAAMGDKLAAKRVAVAAEVPTLPSSDDPTADAEVGYPLLVKAAAGGGGKGMRIVTSSVELLDAVASARREAASGFGDDTVFLERYVALSRHVEIQILGDHHGGLVHLGERECSIQRRHQKIIEESPSPIVDEAMRTAMGEAALALGRAINYRSAGTVEFLVDEATREFYFLEVNTRLQVEHPVTEAVTGVDLVREQLRIAQGAPLGYGQDDISFDGHAIEARLYAEDAAHGFLPAIGTLHAFAPAAEPAIRWDSGVETGSRVSVEFDPMLAKVISHGPTRNEAAGRLALGLERLHLGGVVTNRDFLVNTLRHPAFLAGDTTTDFIDRVQPAPSIRLDEGGLRRAATVGALWLQGWNRSVAPVLTTMPSGFRNSLMPYERTLLRRGGAELAVRYQRRRDGSFEVDFDDLPSDPTVEEDTRVPNQGGASRDDRAPARAVIHAWSPRDIVVEIDGHRLGSRVTHVANTLSVQVPTGTVSFTVIPRFVPPVAEPPKGALVAPMPGTVLEVRVAPGDAVTAGQTLVVLEAMKMEHHMNAPADGVVTEVRVQVGGQVDNDQLLLVFEPHDQPPAEEASA